MSRILTPRRDLVLPQRFRQRQGGFLLNPYRFGAPPPGGGGPDPFWANVVFLAHFNGANGAQVFTEERGHVLTPLSTVETSTAQVKYGSSSARFPSGSSAGITVPSSTDFDFGGGDFCIEKWILTGHASSYATLVCREWVGSPWSGGWSWFLNGNSGSPMEIWAADYSTGGPLLVASGTGYRDSNWHHIAWVRNGNVHTLYMDGTADASATTSFAFASVTKNLTIGCDLTFGARNYAGFMDDMRITKGVPRYTANFTPSAFQFPDS